MLSITSSFPYFAIMGILLVVASVVARWIPFYRSIVESGKIGRYETLDGLRGYLALAVFFHHAVLQFHYYHTGKWGTAGSRLYEAFGPVAVMFFFMITGFLFWSRAIAKQRRVAPIPLYKNRFLRLGPLFFLSILLILAVVFAKSGFRLAVHPLALAGQIARASLLGIGPIGVINGVDTQPINASVTWTLRYEWCFYLALPLLALFATPLRFAGLVAVMSALCLFSSADLFIQEQRLLHFLCGMFAAHLVQHFRPPQFARRAWFTAIVFALLAAATLLHQNLWGLSISLVTFLCFVFGNDLGKLLTIPGAKVLGTISYSVYLLHGIALHILLGLVNRFHPIASIEEPCYWLIITLSGIVVVLCSLLTYRFVEHPFIELSHANRAKMFHAQKADRSRESLKVDHPQ